MGKKPTKKGKSGGNPVKNTTPNDSHLYPFVSICTPTYNRRPFWPMAIQCFNDYDYPKDRIEWIIVDDGSDKIEDLVKDIPQVRYFREERQMILGRKRNYMHEKAKGDIIVYQDDDDYYPPDRISHAVERLMSDPKVLAAGSTVLFLYFKHIQQMYRFGPYGDNHATAGTFAFKRELLKQTKYDDFKALAEEKDFLKGYTIPFIQLDPLKSILVFSHNHNTFDKKKLLDSAPNPTCNPDMNITVDHIMRSESAKKFFLEDIDELLAAYEPGDIKNKPEVLNQTGLIEKLREQQIKEHQEIRRETMARADIQQVRAESQGQVDEMRRNMARVFEVNKQLVNKMKAIKHLLTEEDKKLIEETDRRPPIANIGIENPRLIITQSDNMCNIDEQSIQNIFAFIANHKVVMTLVINDHEKVTTDLTCGLEFTPHPSQQHKYTQQTNQIDLNKALGNNASANVNEDDVNTIMDQTGCNRPTAINALTNEGGDVISCIMNIDSHRCDSLPENNFSNLNEDDINTVMDQTGCNKPTAINALTKENGDVISCIMNIDQYKCEDTPSNSLKVEENIEVQGSDIISVINATKCNQMTAMIALANEECNVEKAIANIDKYKTEDNQIRNIAGVGSTSTNSNTSEISNDDIQTIIDQTGCNKETAEKALKGENNDVVACIMNIDSYKNDNQQSEEGITLSVSE